MIMQDSLVVRKSKIYLFKSHIRRAISIRSGNGLGGVHLDSKIYRNWLFSCLHTHATVFKKNIAAQCNSLRTRSHLTSPPAAYLLSVITHDCNVCFGRYIFYISVWRKAATFLATIAFRISAPTVHQSWQQRRNLTSDADFRRKCLNAICCLL